MEPRSRYKHNIIYISTLYSNVKFLIMSKILKKLLLSVRLTATNPALNTVTKYTLYTNSYKYSLKEHRCSDNC